MALTSGRVELLSVEIRVCGKGARVWRCLDHIRYKKPFRHPSEDIASSVGYKSLERGLEGDIHVWKLTGCG